MGVDVRARVKLLVQQAVEAYVNEQGQESKKPSIAILLSYQSSESPDFLKAVTSMVEDYDVTLLVSNKWLPLPEELSTATFIPVDEASNQELRHTIEKTSLLVIPVASFQLLSKLALTIDDDPSVWTAIQYQLIGKPIVIANNGVELNVYQQISAPHSVQDRLQGYIRRIQSDQVKWVPLRNLLKAVEEQYTFYQEKQPLLLGKHVERANREGLEEIIVPKKSKLTPVAKDLARELKIQIKKQDS